MSERYVNYVCRATQALFFDEYDQDIVFDIYHTCINDTHYMKNGWHCFGVALDKDCFEVLRESLKWLVLEPQHLAERVTPNNLEIRTKSADNGNLLIAFNDPKEEFYHYNERTRKHMILMHEQEAKEFLEIVDRILNNQFTESKKVV